MPCHPYNPMPPKVPLPATRTEFQYKDKDVKPNELAGAFLDFYHRTSFAALPVKTKTNGVKFKTGNLPKKSDTVILTNKQLKGIKKDPEVGLTLTVIMRKIRARLKDYVSTLQCNKKGCFTDSGQEITASDPFSNLSYALGNFSIYWWAECHVGPRICGKNLAKCKNGEGSTAKYTLKVKYAVFDIYDFTGLQQAVPTTWFGTDFYVYGEWEQKSKGTFKYCAKPKYEYGKPCGKSLSFAKHYDILYAIQSVDAPCKKPKLKEYLDSAMGKLYQEGKEICSLWGCTESSRECSPVFSDVELKAIKFYSKPYNERLKECYVKVRLAATVNCHCQSALEKIWPKPDKIIEFK